VIEMLTRPVVSQTPDCFWSDNVGKVYDVLGVIGERTPDGLTMEKFKDGLERYQNARLK
jgi:hypothetical protein